MLIATDNGSIRNIFGYFESLYMIKQAGFDGVDFTFYDMLPEHDLFAMTDSERLALAEQIKKTANEIGISFPQSHAPFRYQYGESKSDKHYTDLIKSFETDAAIGCKQMVVHSLKMPLSTTAKEIERINIEFYKSLLPYADEYDVNIGIEDLFIYDSKCHCYRGQHGTPEEMNQFIDKLNDPRFVCCCDVGHCALTGCEPEDFIAGIDGKRLTMLHIQDLDYLADRHLLPFSGKLNWDAITDSLVKINYKGALCFEVLNFYNQYPPQLMQNALNFAASVAKYLAGKIEMKQKGL